MRIPDDLIEWLDGEAKRMGTSRSETLALFCSGVQQPRVPR
jgi:hypothetical protein